jgi:hypothetical protein
MCSQKVEKPVIATPDLIRGKQAPPVQLVDYWGLLRRFTPRNDSLGGLFAKSSPAKEKPFGVFIVIILTPYF